MPVAWPLAGDLMTARPVTLPHDAPISRALGLMRSRNIHEIPVLQRSRLLGMITFETIARRSSRSVATKVGHLLVVPPLVTPGSTLPEVAAELLATGLRAAPVVGRRGELLGVISRTDLVRALPGLSGLARAPVEKIGRSASYFVRENDTIRHLIGQIRLLEEHALPVVDKRGKLVGAVGLEDLGAILWRPTVGGKLDVVTRGSALDVEVTSIMRSPAFTVAVGSDALDAARLMTREKISSVFVLENGRPTRILAQTDLLSLVVGSVAPAHGKGGVEDVYVEVTGLRGSSDPALLADIDHLVAGSLKRIAHHVRPILLSLHLSPHSTHRTSDLTVEARLHTDTGIFYASHTGWNLMAGISGLMDELTSQVQRTRETRRTKGRRRPKSGAEDETEVVDPELERRIRSATEDEEP
ncbi:MAG: CBS domain-containing protein [Thermoplasmata archaeon]|nr:CBS domain-containing protein [Thermoplasmata archaeon]